MGFWFGLNKTVVCAVEEEEKEEGIRGSEMSVDALGVCVCAT